MYQSILYSGRDEKIGKKNGKIVGGAKQRGKHLGKKWGLADIRNPDDGLGEKIPILHPKLAYLLRRKLG